MTLPIVLYGSPVLRRKAEDITSDYPGLAKLIADMFETMHKSDGLGLAAPQVNKSIRLFVIDTAPLVEDDPSLADFKKAFINAKITERMGEDVLYSEGCLSLPSLREDVARPSQIRIEYYDENFVFHNEVYDGVKARVIQHEYDHTEGVVFTDHLSPLKRKLLSSKLNAISKGKVSASYKVKLVNS
jgi:peptide deformylase